MSARVEVRSVARSHIGEIRQTNEDRVFNCAKHRLWAVADGMGGHNMGDVAAEIVVNSLLEMTSQGQEISKESIEATLNVANIRVLALNGQSRNRSGSTVAGLHLDRNAALIFWAGDSRVYRRRNGVVELLTHDHRLVQEMIDAGLIDDHQARKHPQASVITRAVGATKIFVLASRIEEAIAGDTYLLCSDGLSDLIDTDEIKRSMALDDSEAADRLINAALAAGGSDNISVLLVSIDSDGTSIGGTSQETDLKTIYW